MTRSSSKPVIGLIWAQFSAYHIDRLEAVGRRMAGRARVLAIEVAATSETYAWETSGKVRDTEKRRLFSGQSFERINPFRRFVAQLRAVWYCDVVFVGVAYSMPDIIGLSFVLRLMGKKVVMMTASKFDDFERTACTEFGKRMVLSSYSAAIVGGRRQYEYVRFLGFRKKAVLPGYNTVSMARVRQQASSEGAAVAFEDRSFIFVGRFVDKKNIELMLAGYAAYAQQAGVRPRRLALVGDGPLRAAMVRQCEDLGIAGLVDFKGFMPSVKVSAELAGGFALVLVSGEEQWGLVINEALAVGLPIISSADVGAREALVRNLMNGFVVEAGSLEGIAAAMVRMDMDEAAWQAMSDCSTERAWFADAERFADAAELMVFPDIEPTRTVHAQFVSSILIDPSRAERSAP